MSITTLDIDRDQEKGSRLPRVNWGLVAAVLTILGWLLAAGSGAFGDYRKIGDRVTVLETQRDNDTKRMERIENKLDFLIQRRP